MKIDLGAMVKGGRPGKAMASPAEEADEGSGETDLSEADEADDMEGPQLMELMAKKQASKDYEGAFEALRRAVALCSYDEE